MIGTTGLNSLDLEAWVFEKSFKSTHVHIVRLSSDLRNFPTNDFIPKNTVNMLQEIQITKKVRSKYLPFPQKVKYTIKLTLEFMTNSRLLIPLHMPKNAVENLTKEFFLSKTIICVKR